MPDAEHVRAAVLDTHVWVWVSAGDSRAARLTNFTGRPVVSAISVWEIAMLASKGRLSLTPGVREWLEANLRHPVEMEPLHPTICIESCVLPDFHGDPADRLIVATAIVLGLPLITADQAIIEWNRRLAAVQIVMP
ncbi:MAG: type II toxin-antitoxin system VapC family toxin [Terrimicrobiaceae bacterium]|nr:type II toxin-antitoxin system VapC family toxin [Terrimicrobiaceae bacterium]